MNEANNQPPGPASERGVMGNLPTTRPQRTTARRTAARRKPKQRTPANAAEPPRAPRQGFEARAPRQGFETEDVEQGKPVAPPNSAELATSVVELLGELAQTGLSSGGKLLKDALSRLSSG